MAERIATDTVRVWETVAGSATPRTPGREGAGMRESDSTSSLVLAVLTFRRPQQLARLLPLLLEEQRFLRESVDDLAAVTLVVVDNDPAQSARAAVMALGGEVSYLSEPTPGISHARNRALEAAHDHDLLVFIDDDETPVRGWLGHLVRTQRQTGANGVAGKVTSVADGEVDPFVAAGGFLDRAHRVGVRTGTPIDRAATNNLLVDMHAVRRYGLQFDPRFGLTGGEDSLFTSQLVQSGGSLVWCAEAEVLDHVTVSRMTPDYMLKRARAMSRSEVRVELALRERLAARLAFRAQTVARELARCLLGMLLVLRGRVRGSLPDRAHGARALARSQGAFDGLLGSTATHYGEGTSGSPATDLTSTSREGQS